MRYTVSRGMTLIDIVIGTALMLLVFLGLAGGFKLSIELVGTARAKTSALAILNERMEEIRALPYEEIGTQGGIPSGAIPQLENVSLNGVLFTIRTLIQYVDAPQDGLDLADENAVTADYKLVKIEASWTLRETPRTFAITTTVSPHGIEQLDDGGTLRVEVFDALANPVQGAQVRIVNTTVNPSIDVTALSNPNGVVSFPGSPAGSDYEVTVTKTGYSSAQTYDVSVQNPNPNPGHVAVADAETSTVSFAIDRSGVLRFYSVSPEETDEWSDNFDTANNLAENTNTEVVGDSVVLVGGPDAYVLSGSARSVGVTAQYLASWDEASWEDTVPTGTDARVQVFFDDGNGFVIVPDSALPGNAAGFTTSPIDISGLSTATYGTLALETLLVTTDVAQTPSIDSWGNLPSRANATAKCSR
jgi:hypothetical protein